MQTHLEKKVLTEMSEGREPRAGEALMPALVKDQYTEANINVYSSIAGI